MQRTSANGVELAYDVEGEGEPLLFIHGAIWADFLRPLAAQPALSGFRRIRYHRRGFGNSTGPGGGFIENAADAVALLDRVDVPSAHLVGHSEGAMIALDVAAARPERVASLVLLEPLPPLEWMAAHGFAELGGNLRLVMEAMAGRYESGDVAGAYDALFAPQGLDWRAAATAAGPGVVAQGIDDAATWFEREAPALAGWAFRPEQSAAIGCPVLSWCSNPENPIVSAIRPFLHGLFPGCEDVDLVGGDHFSVATDPAAVAEPIARFVSRHAVRAVAT